MLLGCVDSRRYASTYKSCGLARHPASGAICLCQKIHYFMFITRRTCDAGVAGRCYATRPTDASAEILKFNRRLLAQESSTDLATPQYGVNTIFLDPSEALAPSANSTDEIEEDEPGTGRIAIGQPARNGAYPFAAAILLKGKYNCGGTLIAPRVILTAAHCVYNKQYAEFFPPSSISVRIGDVDRSQGSKRKAKGILVPNTYVPSRSFYGDVALILLDHYVAKTTVKLAATPKATISYRALGWGKTDSGYLASRLQQVELLAISKSKCEKKHWQLNLGVLPRDHFCAGLNRNGADTCVGDSGGAVLSGGYQTGITSYGPAGSYCGKGINFGLYTSVAYWNPWIQDTLSVFNMRGVVAPTKVNKPKFNTCLVGYSFKVAQRAGFMGQCCERCRGTVGCVAWSWNEKSKMCALFDQKKDYKAKASSKCHAGTFN